MGLGIEDATSLAAAAAAHIQGTLSCAVTTAMHVAAVTDCSDDVASHTTPFEPTVNAPEKGKAFFNCKDTQLKSWIYSLSGQKLVNFPSIPAHLLMVHCNTLLP